MSHGNTLTRFCPWLFGRVFAVGSAVPLRRSFGFSTSRPGGRGGSGASARGWSTLAPCEYLLSLVAQEMWRSTRGFEPPAAECHQVTPPSEAPGAGDGKLETGSNRGIARSLWAMQRAVPSRGGWAGPGGRPKTLTSCSWATDAAVPRLPRPPPRGYPACIRSRLLGKLPATSRRLVTNLAQGLPERAESLSEDGVFVGKVRALQFLKRSPGSREGGDRLLHRSVKALICCIAAGSGHSGSIRPLAVRWRAGGPRPPGSLGP